MTEGGDAGLNRGHGQCRPCGRAGESQTRRDRERACAARRPDSGSCRYVWPSDTETTCRTNEPTDSGWRVRTSNGEPGSDRAGAGERAASGEASGREMETRRRQRFACVRSQKLKNGVTPGWKDALAYRGQEDKSAATSGDRAPPSAL